MAKALQFNTDRLPPLRPGRMLEVGCASGSYLHRMASRGWDVAGIELSPGPAAAARGFGYPVHAGPLETSPDPEQPYDLIVAWMAIEHLHEPLLGLRKLRRWTKPGAWLVLSVPNAGAAEFRLFREAWLALHLPNHLFHFTPRTLSLVLSRGGWRTERVFHHRMLSNLVASLGYRMQDHELFPRVSAALVDFPVTGGWPHTLLYPLAFALSLVGQTGRMTVWARRDD